MVVKYMLRNVKTEEKTELPIDGIFVAVGEEPLKQVCQGYWGGNES